MDKVRHLELILDRQNSKQGVGFIVFGRLVDIKTLGNIVGALVSAGLVVLPVIYSLRPHDTQRFSSDDACGLSNDQRLTAQGLFATWNASCAYNLTIGPNGVTLW